jgi:hypothetical protein
MRLPEAMLLDAADEHVAEIGVAKHLRALQDRQSDRHAGRGKRRVDSGMRLEPHGEAGAQFILDEWIRRVSKAAAVSRCHSVSLA